MKKDRLVFAAAIAVLLMAGCQCPMKKVCCGDTITFIKETLGVKPELFVTLDETFSVPDGLAIDANGNVVLAVPNYIGVEKHGAKIVTLNKEGKIISTFTSLPKQADTGQVHPMGIGFGPDGNLYIADNQGFSAPDKSRILRLSYKNGKPATCEVVVTGLGVANAVRWNGNNLYLTDSIIPNMGTNGNMSGIYRFSLEEMSRGEPVVADNEKHLILTSKGEEKGFGADGMDFDKKGNLYFGHFSGGQFFKVTFKKDGAVDQVIRLMNSPAFECCDGIQYDQETEKIYIANSQMNSVWVYDLKAQTMQRLWENGDSDGADGSLDQPCEPLVYGDSLLVVNFDMTFPKLRNRVSDSVNTISKFKIK
jgi:sugar lactone lactonase YvrE